MKIKGLSGIVNLLGIAFLAIALLLALTSPATVGAAPAAQTTATETATVAAGGTGATAATATATTTSSSPSTLPTTGAADQSLALGMMTLAGLGFLGMGLAIRAFAPKNTR